jgi:hypothetical protein
VREFQAIFDAFGIRYGNGGIRLDRRDFPNGNCFYCFDLTANRGASDGHYSTLREGPVRIEVHFAKPLVNAMTCVIGAEFDNTIEVDKDRNPIPNYAGAK